MVSWMLQQPLALTWAMKVKKKQQKNASSRRKGTKEVWFLVGRTRWVAGQREKSETERHQKQEPLTTPDGSGMTREDERRSDDSPRGRPGCQWAAPASGCASTSWVWGCARFDHPGIPAPPCRRRPAPHWSCCRKGCFPCCGQLWQRWLCSRRENGEEVRDLPLISLSVLHRLYQLHTGGNAFWSVGDEVIPCTTFSSTFPPQLMSCLLSALILFTIYCPLFILTFFAVVGLMRPSNPYVTDLSGFTKSPSTRISCFRRWLQLLWL